MLDAFWAVVDPLACPLDSLPVIGRTTGSAAGSTTGSATAPESGAVAAATARRRVRGCAPWALLLPLVVVWMAASRSAFRIRPVPEMPNWLAIACSWGSFRVVRSPDADGAMASWVSVTKVLPSDGSQHEKVLL